MHSFTVIAAVFAAVVVALDSSSSASVLPFSIVCPPSSDNKFQEICETLNHIKVVSIPESVGDGLDTQLYDRGTKRQDVDHVFLRFGRRLGL